MLKRNLHAALRSLLRDKSRWAPAASQSRHSLAFFVTELLLVVATGWGGLAAQAPGTGATLRVRIVDSTSRPIPLANLSISGQGEIHSASPTGWVVPLHLAAGEYRLTLRAIGFVPDTINLTLANGESRSAVVALKRVAYRLRDLVVRERPWAPSLEDYPRRIALYRGRLITQQDIARGGYLHTVELLGTVVGMRLEHTPPTVNLKYGQMEGGTTSFRFLGACGGKGSIYLDGHELMGSPAPLSEIPERLDIVRPSEIELIEVYRRHEEIPARYRDPEACMAVMIWTTGFVRQQKP